MNIQLHTNATTTPKIRAAIKASTLSASELARKYGVTEPTIKKWQHREDVNDRSHTAHNLQTTLSTEQEFIVVELRKTFLINNVVYLFTLPSNFKKFAGVYSISPM